MLNIIIIFFIFLVLLVLVWRFSRSRKIQFTGELVYRVKTKEKIIALTFDDGPMPVFTEKVLDKLKPFGVKATFFLTGNAIERNMSLAKEIVNQGHQVGNHTYSHKKMVFVSDDFVKDEIEKTNQLIHEAGYRGEITFRPPYGKKLFALPMYLKKHSIPTIMWNIEPEKYVNTNNPDNIAEYTVKNTKPGSIILLHPMFESRINTIESISSIVSGLIEKGYRFVTVSELMKLKNS